MGRHMYHFFCRITASNYIFLINNELLRPSAYHLLLTSMIVFMTQTIDCSACLTQGSASTLLQIIAFLHVVK